MRAFRFSLANDRAHSLKAEQVSSNLRGTLFGAVCRIG